MTRELIDLPDTMEKLPRDKRGFPVPAFVEWIDGQPDFRVIKHNWLPQCVKRNLCWVCGCKLGSRYWFVAGPMCTVTRTVSEPPSHRTCAEFAVKNCPFLTTPAAKRNERNLPENFVEAPGIHIPRNPGVAAVWETKSYTVFRPHAGAPGFLLTMGDPVDVVYWREGRHATRDEVLASINGGLPRLTDMAVADGPEAVEAFLATVQNFRLDVLDKFLPGRVTADG